MYGVISCTHTLIIPLYALSQQFCFRPRLVKLVEKFRLKTQAESFLQPKNVYLLAHYITPVFCTWREQLQEASPKDGQVQCAKGKPPSRQVKKFLFHCKLGHRPSHHVIWSWLTHTGLFRQFPWRLWTAFPLPLKPAFPVLQTIGRHYSQAVDNRTYRLGSRSKRNDKTLLKCISKGDGEK